MNCLQMIFGILLYHLQSTVWTWPLLSLRGIHLQSVRKFIFNYCQNHMWCHMSERRKVTNDKLQTDSTVGIGTDGRAAKKNSDSLPRWSPYRQTDSPTDRQTDRQPISVCQLQKLSCDNIAGFAKFSIPAPVFSLWSDLGNFLVIKNLYLLFLK